MEKILLLEAEYRSKFPPVGLMKLAHYHSRIRGDSVRFSKGRLKGKPQQWDRVYITTLFTFAWEQTISLIEYAKTLTDTHNIYVGGIMATLMPDELEAATGIKPIRGLLQDSSQIGYDSGVYIDNLTPDYSILDQIEYRYPFADGYFLTATRGCGMKCSFCAVQTLEPEYCEYIPIIPRVEEIRTLYGEKKNLYLLDNNVLKSRCLPKIIEDIKALGFQRGATYINPKTGKPVRRYVDFNQGLDMNFLNENNVRLLSEIALKPCHLAFDHIDDRERYLRALSLLEQYDIRDVCSFLLYNTPDFSGKGRPRRADTPHDLYERAKINLEFRSRVNQQRKQMGKYLFDAFSFPMRYVPLNAKDRSYVGDNWSPKLLKGVAELCAASHGGIFSCEKTFTHIIGADYEEYYMNLLMPAHYLRHRESLSTRACVKQPSGCWRVLRNEWIRRYRLLSREEKDEFESIISSNSFTLETYMNISQPKFRKLYMHYFHGKGFAEWIIALLTYDPELFLEASHYLVRVRPQILAANFEVLSKMKDGETAIQDVTIVLFLNEFIKKVFAAK